MQSEVVITVELQFQWKIIKDVQFEVVILL